MKELDSDEQICWAFDILPSQFDDLVWNTFWYDVVYKLKLKIGETSTTHLQYYNSIAEVVSMALGGGKEDNKQTVKVNDMAPDDAVNALNNLFGQARNI